VVEVESPDGLNAEEISSDIAGMVDAEMHVFLGGWSGICQKVQEAGPPPA
jgi:hypothetical protein